VGASAGYSLACRGGLLNIAAAAACLALSAALGSRAVAGLAFGYLVGAVNGLWLLKIVRRGVDMAPGKAAAYVTRRYYLRFLLTALVFTAVITRHVMTPWGLVAGLSGAVFTSLAIMALAVREEI